VKKASILFSNELWCYNDTGRAKESHMFNKKTRVLDWVEQYPATEDTFRAYDELVGVCILCQCLFESIEEIEAEYHVDLQPMYEQLKKIVS
jgi:hypothetical protein